MAVLIIDNYDSFTYNLFQYLGELGADSTVRRNDEITIPEVETLAPSHIVLSPGLALLTRDAHRLRRLRRPPQRQDSLRSPTGLFPRGNVVGSPEDPGHGAYRQTRADEPTG